MVKVGDFMCDTDKNASNLNYWTHTQFTCVLTTHLQLVVLSFDLLLDFRETYGVCTDTPLFV
jgi:hypothetical protein